MNFINSDQQSSIKSQLDQIQGAGETLSTESALRLTRIKQDILQAVQQATSGKMTPMGHTVDHVHSNLTQPVPGVRLQAPAELQDIKTYLDKLSATVAFIPLENRILESLSFDTVFSREDSIRNADEETFEWFLETAASDTDSIETESDWSGRHWSPWEKLMFREEQARRVQAQSSFLSWLEGGNGWKLMNNNSNSGAIDRNLLRDRDKQGAFRILVSHTTFPNHWFCFFIDGLDEYDGDSLDHRGLAEDLKNWAMADGIKICASSRPSIEFSTPFSDSPDRRIHLHVLTSHDIYFYARQKLEKSALLESIPDEYLDLFKEVVRMSDGVFLWAWIVTRSLLSRILRGDPIDSLRSN
ncbi:hypothetical protein BJX70DRAFT_401733 [Aspergillus crustosus]